MAQIILTVEDFTDEEKAGRFFIPIIDGCEKTLRATIDDNEKNYLIKLLGCDLASAFIADLVDGVPQTQEYIDIFNEICLDLKNGFTGYHLFGFPNAYYMKKIHSEGMKKMLQGFIFWEFMKDPNKFIRTSVGVIKQKAENGEHALFSEWGISQKYNLAVNNYQNIQYYMYHKFVEENLYSSFNGEKIKKTDPLM